MLNHQLTLLIGATLSLCWALGCNLTTQAQPTAASILPSPGAPEQEQPTISATPPLLTTPTAVGVNVMDVVNQTVVDICYIYVTGLSASPIPSDNLLTDGPLAPGTSTRLVLPDGSYELTAQDCHQQEVGRTTANFIASTFWPIVELTYTPIFSTLTFINHTDETICRIMVGPPNTDGGGDILNNRYTSMGTDPSDSTPIPVITIPPGGSVNVTTTAGGRLTFEAFTCDGEGAIDTLSDVEITGDFTWDIGE